MHGNTIPAPPVHLSVHQDDILPLIVFHIPTICVLVEAREQTVYLTTTHSSFHHPAALPFYCIQKSKILHLKVCVCACEIHFAFYIISLFRLVVYMVYFVVGIIDLQFISFLTAGSFVYSRQPQSIHLSADTYP